MVITGNITNILNKKLVNTVESLTLSPGIYTFYSISDGNGQIYLKFNESSSDNIVISSGGYGSEKNICQLVLPIVKQTTVKISVSLNLQQSVLTINKIS